jgi:anti-sigma regulatory factor (Ser/Thr protein kinase)
LHRLTIAGDTSDLSKVRHWLDHKIRSCREVVISEQLISEVSLAVQEALVNVMEHALAPGVSQQINLAMSCRRTTLRIEISYRGTAFDDAAVAPPSFDGSRDHGFGLFIMKSLMDEVQHGRCSDGRFFTRIEKNLNR